MGGGGGGGGAERGENDERTAGKANIMRNEAVWKEAMCHRNKLKREQLCWSGMIQRSREKNGNFHSDFPA